LRGLAKVSGSLLLVLDIDRVLSAEELQIATSIGAAAETVEAAQEKVQSP